MDRKICALYSHSNGNAAALAVLRHVLLIRLAAYAGLDQSKVDAGVEQERSTSAEIVVAAAN